MKLHTFSLSSFMMLSAMTLSAQLGSGPLDGKSYKIEAWDVTKSNLKTPDRLVFSNGMVDAPVCHEYGFFATPYTSYEKDGKLYFEFTSESQSEGTVTFKGEIAGDIVKGSYIWNKPDEGKLKYQYNGERER